MAALFAPAKGRAGAPLAVTSLLGVATNVPAELYKGTTPVEIARATTVFGSLEAGVFSR